MQALYNEGELGDASIVQAAPITKAEVAKAERRIKKMRRSLKGWLKKRRINDEAAMGKRKAKVPASVLAKTLPLARDWALEQRLAIQLHGLLSDYMDAASLPNPDLKKDPNAAVKLATIAISGRLPNEATAPQSQGLVPLLIWPVVVIVGAVMLTVMSKIGSDADLAELKENNRCIESGACTDSGFWLKLGGIAVFSWVAWDKLGVKKMFNKK